MNLLNHWDYFKMKKLLLVLILICYSAPVFSSGKDYDIDFYGYIRFESFYDQTKVTQGDWLLFVPSKDDMPEDNDVFSMTARHTRVGAKIKGPAINENISTRALVEVDFAGGFPNSGTAARQPLLRLRHAWAEIYTDFWNLKFGQDWALIAGPFPNTASFVVGASKGNLWQRYPQICFSIKPEPVTISVSINRPMAGNVKYDDFAMGDLDPVLDGEITGMPWFMGKVAYASDHLGFSASGHYGTEDVTDLLGKTHNINSYSVNADATVKLGGLSLTVKGFYGENLNSFLGGILQGYTRDSLTATSLPSMGGWANIAYKINDTWAVSAGGGLDDPDDDQLSAGMRSMNQWLFGNVSYSPIEPLVFMLEAQHLTTSYIDKQDGKNLRLQFLTYYKF
jgi:hypothetical protein